MCWWVRWEEERRIEVLDFVRVAPNDGLLVGGVSLSLSCPIALLFSWLEASMLGSLASSERVQTVMIRINDEERRGQGLAGRLFVV